MKWPFSFDQSTVPMVLKKTPNRDDTRRVSARNVERHARRIRIHSYESPLGIEFRHGQRLKVLDASLPIQLSFDRLTVFVIIVGP